MKHRTIRALLVCLLCVLLVGTPLLSGCGSKAPVEKNAVTAVTLDGKGNLVVEGALTKGFLDSYTQKKVYLFELPSLYSTDVDLTELDPVAEVKAKTGIKVKLPLMDGQRSRLYSSFILASFDEKSKTYTALTSPVSVTNPQAAAGETAGSGSAEYSIKGLISDYAADAVRLGISHTVVEVPMSRLILSGWQEDAVSYVYNGVTRYLNAAALDELDEAVGVYTAAGVNVYLRFVLGAPEEETPLGLYVAADRPAEGYAVDMSTGFSSEIVEGFFGFMADRYASPEDGSKAVTSFVLGYRVNDPQNYCYAGDAVLAPYITNYEKLVRVANAALKSHNPDGRVYVSLDNRRAVMAESGGWDVAAFLSAFRSECALRGDFDWNVAVEMYADTPDIWNQSATADAAYYTVHNLNTLTDQLVSDQYRNADGSERSLLISGFSIPAVAKGGSESEQNGNSQAASYAFAYLTCLQNGHVEALIYSEYADTAASAAGQALSGLWTAEEGADGTPVISKPRPIYDVFKNINTTKSSELSPALTTIIGPAFTKLESALKGQTSPVTVVEGMGVLKDFESEHKKASALMDFNGGSLNGFASAGNLTYLELSEAETLGCVTLHARFDRESVSDPMGITTTLPATQLIGGKTLILDLFAGQIHTPDTAAQASPSLTLRLSRPAKGNVADGDGEIVYEVSVSDVKGSAWQTASFDVSAFTAKLDASDEVTLTLLVDYGPGETQATAHNLGLAGIYVMGNTVTSGGSSTLVLVLVILGVLAVAGLGVYLFLKSRR